MCTIRTNEKATKVLTKERADFVKQCGELLRIAKPNLVKCELKLGKDIKGNIHGVPLLPDSEYVVVTAENGYTYNICVEANSLSAIAYDVFNQMRHK